MRQVVSEGVPFLFPAGMVNVGTLCMLEDGTPYAQMNSETFAVEYVRSIAFPDEGRWRIRADEQGNLLAQGLPPEKEDSTLRRFLLVRHHDPTDVSGTGIVAEGVEYAESRMCALFWRNSASGGIYLNADVIREKHCHHGFTDFVWIDEAS